MKLIVTLAKGGQDKYEHLRDYKTQDGELDILDTDAVVVATYAAGMWISVQRHKAENESWPDAFYSEPEDASERLTAEQDFVLQSLGEVPHVELSEND